MATSRMQADKAWLDYQAIILDLLMAIHPIKDINMPDILQGVRKNIKEVSKLYSMQESLEQIYGLHPNYKKLLEIADQIEKGVLDSSESELVKMLYKAESYDPIFKQSCREF